jgi:CcmD family protein
MKLFKKYILLSIFIFFVAHSYAQTTGSSQEQQNFMTADGKIYVVMAVVVVILLGLFIYLFSLDKKISKLEQNKKE